MVQMKKNFYFNKKSNIAGLTTNPSLMRKSGILNYKNFSIKILKKLKKNLFHLKFLLMILTACIFKLKKFPLGEIMFM